MASSQPDTKNFLSPLGFTFTLNRTPNVNYFVQNITLPTLTLGQFDLEDPFVRLPTPGTKLFFDPLTITFMVDEDMNNYLEIYNWLQGLGFPENFQQYSDFRNNQGEITPKATDVHSDGSLVILSSHKNPNLNITFEDMFPISLTDLNFDATMTDVEYLRATVTFRYKLYRIERF